MVRFKLKCHATRISFNSYSTILIIGQTTVVAEEKSSTYIFYWYKISEMIITKGGVVGVDIRLVP